MSSVSTTTKRPLPQTSGYLRLVSREFLPPGDRNLAAGTEPFLLALCYHSAARSACRSRTARLPPSGGFLELLRHGIRILIMCEARGVVDREYLHSLCVARLHRCHHERGAAACGSATNTSFRVRIQSIDATHWPNRSAGVSKPSVFRGRSFSRRAMALSLF